MIHLHIRNTAVNLDFTFFAVIALFLAFDVTGFGILSVLVCLIHEAGHLFAMLIRGEKVESIVFRGGGIKIIPEIKGGDSIFVTAAGSAVNIGLFFLLYFTLPKTDIYPVMFAVLNLVIGLFNLLPVGCLDGKRLVENILPYKVARIVEIIALAVILVGVAAAFVFGSVNFTLLIVIIYIMVIDIFIKV
ncbi:MAG: hypothetical protein FWD34_07990 [Oscillospiraceae bacterium]|nr:hypothetical protein [Oscillospiraceae bacterium]